ncbi:MAG: hypothetical protein DRO11_01950 [Methanobacteriota archaeon]|nr:MAG: hypothetical protein DRO11_01950 [Euryarchaeota archaeon]
MVEIRVRIKRGDRELELGGDPEEVNRQLTTLYPTLFEEEITPRKAAPAKRGRPPARRRRKAPPKEVKTPPDIVDKIMDVLKQHPEPMTMSEVAKKIGIDRVPSRIIGQMKADGKIEMVEGKPARYRVAA